MKRIFSEEDVSLNSVPNIPQNPFLNSKPNPTCSSPTHDIQSSTITEAINTKIDLINESPTEPRAQKSLKSIDRYSNYTFPNSSNSAGEYLPFEHNDQSSKARMRQPSNLVIGKDGSLYIAETFNHVIRKIEPGGQTSIFVGLTGHSGSSNGQGTSARLFWPTCLCMDSKGRMFVADSGNEVIRMVTQDGIVTTIAGTCGEPGHIDGHENILFCCPIGIICDESDRLYVADAGNHCIRVITFNEKTSDETDSEYEETTEIKVENNEETSHNSELEVTTLLFKKEEDPMWPSALMVDAASNVFLLDKSSGHMSRITADGRVYGDFEDYGDDNSPRAVQDKDNSGFVLDNIGYLSGIGAPPRAYVIEKMDLKLMDRYRRGEVDTREIDELLKQETSSPLQAYVMMSMGLDSEGNPLADKDITAPTASC